MVMNPADLLRDVRQYVSEVQAEYRKIVWPPQKEAVVGTIGVVVVVTIVTTALGVVDYVLSVLLQLVL